MASNNALPANTIGVVNTVASNVRVIVVTNAASNSWALKAITVDNFLANSTHDVKAANLVVTFSNTPANSTALTIAGGQIFYDSNYLYVAVANNTVKRVALSTF